MKRVYIAAPIFNQKQLAVVRGITMEVRMLGFEYFSPYEASQEIWKGRAPKDCSQEERDQVLKGNIDNLHTCDLLLCWVGGTEDGRTDTGVVWEMGYFDALTHYRRETRNPMLGFTLAYIDEADKRQHMNLMLAGTVDAVAYGPAQLHRATAELRDVRTVGMMDVVADKFHPSRHLQHEADPII